MIDFVKRSWWALLLIGGILLWLVGMAGWPDPVLSALIFMLGLAVIIADGLLVGRSSSNG